jgi:taurine dioxygenase
MGVEFKPLESIGVEVIGLDASRPIDDATKARMYEEFLDHGVMLFRNICTTPEIHFSISKCFGDLEEHALKDLHVEGNKNLIAVSARTELPPGPSYWIKGKLTTGFLFWHQDLVYTPEICKGAVLRMIECPKEGGETGWIDTTKVYDALPESTKKRIEGLEARHCLRLTPEGIKYGLPSPMRQATQEEVPWKMAPFPKMPDTVHPLVSIHPETGRKSLAISPYSIISILRMSPQESDALISELVAHTLQPQFMYIHKWAPNDAVLWDNRRTLHQAFGYPAGLHRVAHRTTLDRKMKSGRLYSEAA